MSFLRNAGFLTINRFVGAVLSLVISAISARLLKPDELGAIVATIAAIALLMRLLSLGLGQSAQFFGARCSAESLSFNGALIISILPSLALSVILILFAEDEVGTIFLGKDPILKGVFSILQYGIPLSFIHFIASLYALGKRELTSNLLLGLSPLIGMLIILIWALVHNLGLHAIITAWFVQFLLSAFIGIFYLTKKEVHRPAPIAISVKRIYHFGFHSFLVFVTSFAQTRIILLSGIWFTNSSELAYFSVASTFAESLLLVYGAIGPLVFSHTAGLTEQRLAVDFISKISRIFLIIFLAVSILIALIAPICLPLIFGSGYHDKHLIVWTLLPGIILCAQQRLMENYLYGRSKQKLLVYVHTFNILFSLISSAVLAPKYGAIGLAVATTLSYLLSYILTLKIAWFTDRISAGKVMAPQLNDFKEVYSKISRNLWNLKF